MGDIDTYFFRFDDQHQEKNVEYVVRYDCPINKGYKKIILLERL
jgi:hypothetical protein